MSFSVKMRDLYSAQLSFQFQIIEQNKQVVDQILYTAKLYSNLGVVLVGGRGGGKTTLLRHIHSLSGDSIYIPGNDMKSCDGIIRSIVSNHANEEQLIANRSVARKLIILDDLDKMFTTNDDALARNICYNIKTIIDNSSTYGIFFLLSSSSRNIITPSADLTSRFSMLHREFLV